MERYNLKIFNSLKYRSVHQVNQNLLYSKGKEHIFPSQMYNKKVLLRYEIRRGTISKEEVTEQDEGKGLVLERLYEKHIICRY